MVMEKTPLDASAALERGGTVIGKTDCRHRGDRAHSVRGAGDFTVVLMNYWAAAAFNEVFAEHCRGDYKRWRELIGKTISEGVSQGELRPDADVKQIADMLTLIADGLSVGITLTPSIYPRRYRGIAHSASDCAVSKYESGCQGLRSVQKGKTSSGRCALKRRQYASIGGVPNLMHLRVSRHRFGAIVCSRSSRSVNFCKNPDRRLSFA